MKTKYIRMQEVIKANKKAGEHFFDEDAMRFFGSEIESDLFPNDMFVTSENNFFGDKRYYTVRRFDRETGIIHDVGAFQEHETREDAITTIEELL